MLVRVNGSLWKVTKPGTSIKQNFFRDYLVEVWNGVFCSTTSLPLIKKKKKKKKKKKNFFNVVIQITCDLTIDLQNFHQKNVF